MQDIGFAVAIALVTIYAGVMPIFEMANQLRHAAKKSAY